MDSDELWSDHIQQMGIRYQRLSYVSLSTLSIDPNIELTVWAGFRKTGARF